MTSTITEQQQLIGALTTVQKGVITAIKAPAPDTFNRPPQSLMELMDKELCDLRRDLLDLKAAASIAMSEHQMLLNRHHAVMAERDALLHAGTELFAELQALKAKYEPAPEPVPNPWGRIYRGDPGSAIER